MLCDPARRHSGRPRPAAHRVRVEPPPALVSDCRPDDLDLRSEIPVRRHPVGMARVRPAGNAESLVRPACVVSDKSQAEEVPIDASALLWAAPAFTVVSVLGLIWARKLAGRRRASLGVMRRFGARFISEFERPLFRSAVDSPVKSRLRFAPARQRLEILLAPADGRTYPNLADHRRNVEYDVQRVLRLLMDEVGCQWTALREGAVGGHPVLLRNLQAREGVP